MRKKLNECILQFLYGYEILGKISDPSDTKLSMKLLLISKAKVQEAREISIAISEKIEKLDEEIKNISRDYEFERISKVDLSILRMAFYLIDEEKSEIKDMINEAIRLSKKFSTKEASKFIHAILDERVSLAEREEVPI